MAWHDQAVAEQNECSWAGKASTGVWQKGCGHGCGTEQAGYNGSKRSSDLLGLARSQGTGLQAGSWAGYNRGKNRGTGLWPTGMRQWQGWRGAAQGLQRFAEAGLNTVGCARGMHRKRSLGSRRRIPGLGPAVSGPWGDVAPGRKATGESQQPPLLSPPAGPPPAGASHSLLPLTACSWAGPAWRLAWRSTRHWRWGGSMRRRAGVAPRRSRGWRRWRRAAGPAAGCGGRSLRGRARGGGALRQGEGRGRAGGGVRLPRSTCAARCWTGGTAGMQLQAVLAPPAARRASIPPAGRSPQGLRWKLRCSTGMTGQSSVRTCGVGGTQRTCVPSGVAQKKQKKPSRDEHSMHAGGQRESVWASLARAPRALAPR